MSIEIKGVTKDETAYDKYVQLTYAGESYSILLHWDKYDGYDLTFTKVDETYTTIDDPDWAINWEDNEVESLASVIDSLSDEALEASYL